MKRNTVIEPKSSQMKQKLSVTDRRDKAKTNSIDLNPLVHSKVTKVLENNTEEIKKNLKIEFQKVSSKSKSQAKLNENLTLSKNQASKTETKDKDKDKLKNKNEAGVKGGVKQVTQADKQKEINQKSKKALIEHENKKDKGKEKEVEKKEIAVKLNEEKVVCLNNFQKKLEEEINFKKNQIILRLNRHKEQTKKLMSFANSEKIKELRTRNNDRANYSFSSQSNSVFEAYRHVSSLEDRKAKLNEELIKLKRSNKSDFDNAKGTFIPIKDLENEIKNHGKSAAATHKDAKEKFKDDNSAKSMMNQLKGISKPLDLKKTTSDVKSVSKRTKQPSQKN